MATTRIARPLERNVPAPTWWQGIVGSLLLAIALALLARRVGIDQVSPWLVPLLVFAGGVALVWSPLDSVVSSDARRPDIAGLFSPDTWWRVALGITASAGSMLWFANWEFTESVLARAIVVPVAVVAAVALLFAPWWLRLIRQVGIEREQRVREFERAEIAAHLHDSVLQTLTLIRARADDPDAVARLARAQERDLRSYLYQERRSPDESFAAALAVAVSEIEDSQGVAIDVVTVGDGPTTTPMHAAIKAAREALHNAARHGKAPISVYAELTEAALEIFIRDGGPGFKPSDVPGDRLGIANSIVGRVKRHGGAATVSSSPGEPTEVFISVPKEEP